MPRVTFSTDNKSQNAYDYPRVFLEKGARERLVALEENPLMEYVHTLRAPVIVDGHPVIETVTKFGKTVEEPKYDFIGRGICIGDYTVIDDKGVDPRGCPVCKASTESDAVKAPERRFGMHVLSYALTPGGFQPQNPFQVSLKAWTFGNKIFDQLVDFAAEWGDLKQHDLLLGPCEVKQYQKFDIQVAAKAEWLASDERKNLAVQVYKANQCKDLGALIGRKLTREMIEDDLTKVLTRYRQAFGGVREDVPDIGEVAAAIDMSGLLGDESTTVTKTPEPVEVPVEPAGVPQEVVQDLSSFMGDTRFTAAPAEGAPAASIDDLSSLLEGI